MRLRCRTDSSSNSRSRTLSIRGQRSLCVDGLARSKPKNRRSCTRAVTVLSTAGIAPVASRPPHLEIPRWLRNASPGEAAIEGLALRHAGEDVARAVCDSDQEALVIDKELEVAEVPPSILSTCLDLIPRLRRADGIGFSGMERRIVPGSIGARTA
jgi:hypothetical protein